MVKAFALVIPFLLLLFVILQVSLSVDATPINFSDDFEDGNLNLTMFENFTNTNQPASIFESSGNVIIHTNGDGSNFARLILNRTLNVTDQFVFLNINATPGTRVNLLMCTTTATAKQDSSSSCTSIFAPSDNSGAFNNTEITVRLNSTNASIWNTTSGGDSLLKETGLASNRRILAFGIGDAGAAPASNWTIGYVLYNFTDVNFPTFLNNGSNVTSPVMGDVMSLSINASEDYKLANVTLEHNITNGGAITNITIAAGGTRFNATFNITVGSFTSVQQAALVFRFYVTDEGGNTNSTAQRTFLALFNNPPNFTNIQNNASGSSIFENVSFGANITDSHELSFATVANNRSGSFVNESLRGMSGTAGFLNTSLIINLSGNSNICFMVWANDSRGASNTTTSCFSVANTEPIPINVQINNTPIITNNANLSWDEVDLDNDTIIGFETRWFVNGARIAKADNSRYLTSDNFTTGDSIIGMVNITDGTASSIRVNTTNITVADSTAPLILDNFTSPSGVQVQTVINIFVNVTDASSDIASVTIRIVNPNSALSTLLATLDSGTNAAGSTTRWTAPFTPTVVGNHRVNVTVEDTSGNMAHTVMGFLNFSVTAAGGGGGGGGGGGAPSFVTLKQEVKTPFCGDNTCQANLVNSPEDILNCPQDCLGLGRQGVKLGAGARFVLFVIVASVALILLRGSGKFPKSLKGVTAKSLKRRGLKLIPEGFRDGKRII